MLTAIDLFAGAGGLSLGVQSAGFETVFAVEWNADACQTFRAKHKHTEVHCGDIKPLSFKRWRGVDLVVGGPPCQPFSTGGHRQGQFDERDLLPEFVRVVLEVRPRAFLMENVPGLASPAHRDYLQQVMKPLFDHYAVAEPVVLNAAHFGVPQSRRRLFIVGSADKAVTLPTGEPEKVVPAGSVLGIRPRGEPNASKVVYAKNPDLRPNPYHGQLFNGGGRAIDLDAPAPTILASAGGNKTHFVDVGGHVPPYHTHLMNGGRPRRGELPDARRLTVEESALLQTFPKGMEFAGSRSSQYTQIGNAVPPQLAAVLVDHIRRKLNLGGRVRRLARAS